jgi:hypothetical protein
MPKSSLSIGRLEDRQDTVYAIGVGRDTTEPVVKYLYGPDFEELWNRTFEHADYIMIPGSLDSVVQVEASSVEEVESLLEANGEQ